MRTVRRVRAANPMDPDAACSRDSRQLSERCLAACYHGRIRCIDRRHARAAYKPGDELLGRFLRELDDSHATRAFELAQQCAAPCDDCDRVLQTERPAHVGRRDLSLAVPDDRVRLDAPRPPQRRQRNGKGEERGLYDVDSIVGRCQLRLPLDHVDHGPTCDCAYGLIAGPHASLEDRLMCQEPAAHALPLRALAGEDKHQLWTPPRCSRSPPITTHEGVQLISHSPAIAGRERDPAMPLGRLFHRDRGELVSLATGHPWQQLQGPRAERRLRGRRKWQDDGLAARRLLECHVTVGAAEAKGADPRIARLAPQRPGLVLCLDDEP